MPTQFKLNSLPGPKSNTGEMGWKPFCNGDSEVTSLLLYSIKSKSVKWSLGGSLGSASNSVSAQVLMSGQALSSSPALGWEWNLL